MKTLIEYVIECLQEEARIGPGMCQPWRLEFIVKEAIEDFEKGAR